MIDRKSLLPYEFFTAGFCTKTGKGGRASILRDPNRDYSVLFCGHENNTSMMRMELLSIIIPLRERILPSVSVYSNSTLLRETIEKDWITQWKNNKWRRKKNKLLHTELWEELYQLSINLKFNWKFVDVPYNNEMDFLKGLAYLQTTFDHGKSFKINTHQNFIIFNSPETP